MIMKDIKESALII